MASLRFPSGKDISLEINGKRLAVAQSYQARASRESRYVEAFGAPEPVGTVGGQIRHLLELTRVYVLKSALSDGIDFYGLSDFNVVIVKPDRKVIYSGCEWADIQEKANLDGSILETVKIAASKRLEIGT